MLSTLDYLNIGVTLAVVASYSFIFYSSLLVRRTLAVGLYRRHAFGVGLLGVVFAVDQVTNVVPTGEGQGVLGLLGIAFFAVFSLGLLYWVDSSILAARRSDPLYRDTFGWSRLRKAIWGADGLAFLTVLLTSVALPPQSGPQPAGTQGPPEWLLIVFTVMFFFPIYSAALSGVVIMPIAARRCRDLVFRKHLEWLFVFIAIQLVFAGGVGQALQTPNGDSTAASSLVDGVALLIGLYPIYMSVRRLVPLYRFADEGPDKADQEALGPSLLESPKPLG
jgi:hypothetical protein